MTKEKGPFDMRVTSLRQKMEQKETDAFLVNVNEGYNWENAYYLSGFRGTSCSIIITGQREFLITDARYLQQAREQTSFEVVDQGGRTMVEAIEDLLRQLGPSCAGYEGERISESFFRKLGSIRTSWKDLSKILPYLRRFKDEKEQENIATAADIASRAFERTLEEVHKGMQEKSFANLLEFNVREAGAECGWPGHGFVVVSGLRSSMPHGVPTERAIQKSEIVTVDFGATYKGYVADITRNFCIGRPDGRLEEIHEIVLEAHEKAAASIRPGTRCRDIDNIARMIIANRGYGKYFNHGLGHGIGLEIHEGPRLSSSSEDVLCQQNVVTVEPGIYIEGLGGIRIEDDYIVTEKGTQCLSQGLDRKLYVL